MFDASFRQISTLFCAAATASSVVHAQQDNPSQKIDALVEAGYKAHKITPNAPTSDEVFCRRIYLDAVGRIPSRAELKEFLQDTSPNKRAKLIEKLVESEGFTSHFYNYWADILRVQTDDGNQNQGSGAAYADWVKKAIRSNMPYDQMVRELVGAKGQIWNNGAVGYYLRDAGMPLDNMSNTAQIFLGTRVVCAQCHNHPFDKWKQDDYYQMAAFTYGVDTERNVRQIVPGLAKIIDKDEEKAGKGRKSQNLRELENAIRDILEPLTYGVGTSNKQLRLPKDYKQGEEGYEGKADEVVDKAKTLFGLDKIEKPGLSHKIRESRTDKEGNLTRDTRDELLDWMCNSQNPRFNVVIANRLWKKAFGIGLVEPVDDFKDDTLASNPVLMKFLTDEMVKNKYDMRKYMKMLFNTRTYQRQATTAEVSTEEPYYFQGPVLRRMSGEQIWDSLVTLMIPNPDYRKRSGGYQNRLASMKAAADELQKKFVDNPQGAKTLVEMALKGRDAARAFEGKISDLRRQLDKAREGKDVKLTADLQKQLAKAQEEQEVARYKAIGLVEDKLDQSMEKASFFKPKKMEEMKPENKESVDPENRFTSADWEGYSEEYYRASELASPMPQSHFLRVFGQSDRNVIENAWIDASVTQALALMNGDIYDELTSEKSMLYQALKDAVTPTEKAKILWNSVLNRDPSDQEKAMVVEFFNKMSESRKASGWKELFWCLLNGREFIFVQ